jgi:hypothetical protein
VYRLALQSDSPGRAASIHPQWALECVLLGFARKPVARAKPKNVAIPQKDDAIVCRTNPGC